MRVTDVVGTAASVDKKNSLCTGDEIKRGGNDVRKESVELDTAMDQAGCGKFNYLLLLLALPANWSSCFNTTGLSIVLPVAGCQLGLTSATQYGALISAPYAGMLCSGFAWGFLSDSYGRQKLMPLGFLLDAVLVVLSGFAGSFWSMALLKFLSGLVIFGPYTIYMTYLSEVFGKRYRDLAVLSSGFFFNLGCLVQPALALAIVPLKMSFQLPLGLELNSWRLFLVVCALPSLVAGLGTAFCVESPKFLLEQGRKDEALHVLRKIYYINTGHAEDTFEVTEIHLPKKMAVRGDEVDSRKGKIARVLTRSIWQMTRIFRQPYISASIFATVLQVSLSTTLDVVRFWLPQLLSELLHPTADTTTLCDLLKARTRESNSVQHCFQDIDPEVYTNMMIIFAASLTANILSNLLVHFLNKQVVLVVTALIPAVCVMLIPNVDTGYVVALAAVFISLLNAYFYVHIAVVVQLYPTQLRVTGVSLAMLSCRLGSVTSSLVFTQLLYTNCSMVFYIFGSILACMSVGSFFVPSPSFEEESRKERTEEEKKKNIT